MRNEPAAMWGSIPASAGEPGSCRVSHQSSGVYPRECGGATRRWTERWPRQGLSPRVRGSRGSGPCGKTRHGSIPASAGEPAMHTTSQSRPRVYPRECGGAHLYPLVIVYVWGLSPRVRGSLCRVLVITLNQGSIPASAGEPNRCGCRSRFWKVYPRECGGASEMRRSKSCRTGLSPRVRGSPTRSFSIGPTPWSIPASAGEPELADPGFDTTWVYPRECGGAPGRFSWSRRRAGSIPASAGEPLRRSCIGGKIMVYPRECGGAFCQCPGTASCLGLSPRVRGSRISRGVV